MGAPVARIEGSTERRLVQLPHYKTIKELELSPAQVNLLAQLSSWAVPQDDYPVEYTDGRARGRMTSAQLFRSLYR